MAGIAIVDYGMANLRSVQKAFERIGHEAVITSDPAVVSGCDRLVLPGVGAFRDAIGRLRETGLDGPIRQVIDSGRPFLGICLGLQLLFTSSEEEGRHAGLNVLPGEVVRFESQPGLKIPHMGWNHLDFVGDCPSRPFTLCTVISPAPPIRRSSAPPPTTPRRSPPPSGERTSTPPSFIRKKASRWDWRC